MSQTAIAPLPVRSAPAPAEPRPQRLVSIDAYRGLVMLLMVGEVLALAEVATHFPHSAVWKLIAYHTTHVQWFGCSLHDMIQPSFSFLVGVAVPFSIASRKSRGHGFWRMFIHAIWRALLLIALGIFLRSVYSRQTNFTFEDTLTQIGLGYVFLFLLGFVHVRWQALAVVAILVGYWVAFVAYPAPPKDFNYTQVGVPANWPNNRDGLGAHFNKNTNLAMHVDQWFLNLFPREKRFEYNAGGYATLSFIPTLGTMILGLMAGGLLRSPRAGWKKVGLLLVLGAAGVAAGSALDYFNICPIVKRIWTPAWTIYSGGICAPMLAGFYTLTDWPGIRFWAMPLAIIGMNSIAMYVLADIGFFKPFITRSIKTHLGQNIFMHWGPTWAPLAEGACILAVFWLIALWMYRRKLFIRI